MSESHGGAYCISNALNDTSHGRCYKTTCIFDGSGSLVSHFIRRDRFEDQLRKLSGRRNGTAHYFFIVVVDQQQCDRQRTIYEWNALRTTCTVPGTLGSHSLYSRESASRVLAHDLLVTSHHFCFHMKRIIDEPEEDFS